MTCQYDGNREEDQQEICDDVADCHGEQLHKALPTLTPRIRHDLPVVLERLALREVCDADCNEGGSQSAADHLEEYEMGPSPGCACETLEELEDGVFQDPHCRCIEDATRENKATGDLPSAQFLGVWWEGGEVGIVCTPDENDMDASHPDEEGHKGEAGDSVFLEQPLGPDEATCNPKKDDGRTEQSDPPADQERWLVFGGGVQWRW